MIMGVLSMGGMGRESTWGKIQDSVVDNISDNVMSPVPLFYGSIDIFLLYRVADGYCSPHTNHSILSVSKSSFCDFCVRLLCLPPLLPYQSVLATLVFIPTSYFDTFLHFSLSIQKPAVTPDTRFSLGILHC